MLSKSRDGMTKQLARFEAELSALPPVSEMNDTAPPLRPVLLAMIEFLQQEIIRHQADCVRKENISQLIGIAA